MRAVAGLLLPVFLAGCVLHAPPEDAAPPSEAQARAAADFEAGRRDGAAKGEHESVAGSFCIGGVVGVLLPLALLAAAGASSGSSCGNCNGGGGGGPGTESRSFAGGQGASPAYEDGFHEGYQSAYGPRRDRAAAFGFLSGLALFAVGAGVYLASQPRRDRAADDLGNASSPAGVTVFRF